jgi:hypothetical protein
LRAEIDPTSILRITISMVMRRLFGQPPAKLEPGQPARAPGAAPVPGVTAETDTVRRISSELQALPLDQRKFVAGFAYVLGRAAHGDLSVSDEEAAMIERTVAEVGGLSEAQAVLVVEIARHQAELYGATEDYLVTREFASAATREQRERLLRGAFAVAAADSIDAMESAELNSIGKELGFTDGEVDSMRLEFRDQLSAVQQMRRMVNGSSSSGA